MTRAGTHRAPRALALAAALASLAWHVPRLPEPLVGAGGFRQTQTAITVREIVAGRSPLLDYETPVFGPPWQVPFEFPTFQLSAAALAKGFAVLPVFQMLPGNDASDAGAAPDPIDPLVRPVDLACRVAALAWFYLSAALLWLWTQRTGRAAGEWVGAIAVGLYLLSPLAFEWAASGLIDGCSVALGFAWLLQATSWLEQPKAWKWLAATGLGALAAMTKLTTVPGFLLLIGVAGLGLGVFGWRRREPHAAATRWDSVRLGRLVGVVGLAGIVLLPLIAAVLWTRHADDLKRGWEATRWLASDQLHTWVFGTWLDRLSGDAWGTLLARVGTTILPGVLIAMPLAAWDLRRREPPVWRVAWWSLLAAGATLLVFFPLHTVHPYYQIAIAPFLAIAAAAGLYALAALPRGARWAVGAIVAVWSLVVAADSLPAEPADDSTRRIAEQVASSTTAEEWVLVEYQFWNPSVLYASGRRGRMLRSLEVPEYPPGHRYAVLVCEICGSDLIEGWPDRRLVAREGDVRIFRLDGRLPVNPSTPSP